MNFYHNTLKLLILNAMLCLACTNPLVPAFAAGVSDAPPKTIQGSVTQNEMIDNLERVGIKCIFHQGATPKTGYLAVDSVRMGSAAYYQGVEVGDKIKSLSSANNVFTLQIERNGQPYQLQLKALSPVLASAAPLKGSAQQKGADVPVVDVSQSKIPVKDVPPKDKEEKKLIQYDIELLIDVTGSMTDKDGTGDLTKFEWCHEQIRAFAKLMAEYKRTFTITTFNTGFKTEYHCNPSRLEELYGSIKPAGSTCLVTPLIERLEHVRSHPDPGRATIVAVITDGEPNVPRDPLVVNRALVDFTKKLSKPDDIVITFLQIGDTFNGKSFCIDLDDNLVNEGAKYDIIDTKTFDELKSEGLTAALIDAVTEKRSSRSSRATPRHLKMSPEDEKLMKDVESNLKDKMDERKALEKMLNFDKPKQP
ncbi:MAG: hypothetical protein JST89_06760 [Cyanobacteria bacterium SZAS-4]|nr:hypothetical protein [Cyanobacteria bacterium SZAS-4]